MAKVVKKQLGIALIQADIGDPIIMITKKIKSAKNAIEHKLRQNHIDRDKTRMLTHIGQVSLVIIPTVT